MIDVSIAVAIGVVAIFIVDRIVLGLKSRGIDLARMAYRIDELYKWHDRTDEEGVPVWYVRKSLEQAIAKMAENSEQQTQLLAKMDAGAREFRKYLVDKLGENI